MTTVQRLFVLLASLVVLVSGCNKDASDTGASEPVIQYELWPPEGGQGHALSVQVDSIDSVFVYGATEISFGEGIDVTGIRVDDGWTLIADILVQPDAELGVRDVSILVEDRDTVLSQAFRVRADSFTITPDNGKIGETVEVTLYGNNTEWEAGRSWVTFGDDITVSEFTVVTPTEAVAQIAIEADAAPGWRDVYTEDGPHVVTLYDGFLVDRVALAGAWEPAEATQGRTVEFSVSARGTAFEEGETDIEFFQGTRENGDIVIDQITVVDAENLWGEMTLSNAADLGMRDVHIITGTEGVVLEDAFEVLGADPSLDEVAVGLYYTVVRTVDNSSGATYESISAVAYFVIPLDPSCPEVTEVCTDGEDNDYDGYTDCYDSDCSTDMACSLGGPQPYDDNVVTPSYQTGGDPYDCPSPTMVSAGDYVWLESEVNTVTLEKYVDSGSGGIYYVGQDLTMDDYATNVYYDLHLQGDSEGLPEEIVERVLPTVPADWTYWDPTFSGNLTQDRNEPFTYTWGHPTDGTPGAQTYPDSIFYTSIGGTTCSEEYPDKAWWGEGCSLASYPWDDGEHTYEASQLLQLTAADVSFTGYSYVEGPYFGLADSIYQTNSAYSYIYIGGSMTLE